MKDEDISFDNLFSKSSYERSVFIPSIENLKKIIEIIKNILGSKEQHISLLRDIEITANSENELNLNFIHQHVLFRKYQLNKKFKISPFDNDEEFEYLQKFLAFADARFQMSEMEEKTDIKLITLLFDIKENKKNKVVRRIAEELVSNKGVSDYYRLAKCLPNKLEKNQKLSRTLFDINKNEYINGIKNVIRTLKRKWKKYNYTIKIFNEGVKITSLPIK